MSQQTRINRLVKIYSFLWQASPVKLAVGMAVILLVGLLGSAFIFQNDSQTTTTPSDNIVAVVLIVVLIGIPSVLFGLYMKYFQNRYVQLKLQKYQMTCQQYLELLLYTNKGLLPARKDLPSSTKLLVRDRIQSFQKYLRWIPVIYTGLSAYYFGLYLTHTNRPVVCIIVALLLLVSAIYYPIRIHKLILPKLQAILEELTEQTS